MFGGDKTSISQLLVKYSEQTDHHSTMQRHLEKVEAIEVLDCTLSLTCNILVLSIVAFFHFTLDLILSYFLSMRTIY